MNEETLSQIKRSKYWECFCDILDENFPKGKCKERGAALVMLSMIEFVLCFGEEEFRKRFLTFKK